MFIQVLITRQTAS